MKKYHVLLIILISLARNELVAKRIPNPPEGYKIILSDDFDGSELNEAYWTKGLWGANGTHLFPNYNSGGGTNKLNSNYAGYILDKNVVVTNGNLELHNIKEDHPGGDPEGPFHFTNGWIQGLGKITFNGTEKSIVIRMRMKWPTPEKDDVWPAVWLVEPTGWPPEIDIWEYFGSPFNSNPDWDADDRMAFRYIWGENFNKRGSVKHDERWFDREYNADEFQVYEFEWNDRVMTSKVDGKEIGRFTRGLDVPENEWPKTGQDWSVIINNGRMQTTVNGYGLNYATSNVFVIDWIDIFEKDISTSLFDGNLNNKDWLDVYPNPVKDILYLNTEHPIEHIQLYDIMGRCIATKYHVNTLDLNALPQGTYLLKVKTGDRSLIEQIIKW
ncbi:MAG: T9SS type A sorting domain-containing protein [Saprospiraceae bacterium]|nr:T9SS type A sorting domain-containing protein [Saprospiraceae bacterium]